MTVLWTLGGPNRRTQFSYEGAISTGVVLFQAGKPQIEPALFNAALQAFSGREVKGGFKEDAPPSGGFGEWVQNNSRSINGRRLTPRHASFIAAILCHEAGVTSRLDGVSVWLKFPHVA
jgi:hypothetical protein